MKGFRFKASVSLAAVVSVACWSVAASAQEADDAAAESEEIIVTAVAKGSNRLDTSVSVSTLSEELIAASAPRSAAEILRNIPGIRSESSGGEGNANIAVRGLPVASGGAKFLQLQEDGLPILEYGDITFGNADIFLRADFNVSRVESVRGGSASTFASNSPGGVVNFISKTGEQAGGAIQLSTGIDYEEYRVDADYGGSLGNDTFFHVGGFYRQGTGPRDVGYNGLKGGQIKANITKKFDRGYIRLSGKYLDDRAVGYLPNPVLVTGTNSNPKYSNVPGFDINGDSLHSRFFKSATTLNASNQRQSFDITDGMRPLVKSVGFEGSYDVTDSVTIVNRFRFSDISGSFNSPFPGSVDTAANVTANVLGDNPVSLVATRLAYANGPGAGTTVPGSALVARVVLFNTRLKSLDNITNDFRVNYSGEIGGGNLDLTGGLYASRQDIETEWLWTGHLFEVAGGGNARLIDAFNGATPLTDGGTVGYGATFFGNCCRRVYDLQYKTYAPFASATLTFDNLTLDASIRSDFLRARGQTFGADNGGGRIGVIPTDVNGNGSISNAETRTSVVPLTQPSPVNYNFDYRSYSFGANYKLQDDLAIFARYSRGGRANADRIAFNNDNIDRVTGALQSPAVAVDFVKQLEGGVKYSSRGVSVFATVFHAKTEEENFEATTQRTFSRSYKATGIELEGAYRVGGFSLRAGGTYTDAEISRDNRNAGVVGNRPRRQAKFVYQGSASYETDMFTVGASAIGTTDSFAGDSNLLRLPSFTQVNAFLAVRPIDRVEVSLNANNLFNVEGYTEAEEDAIPGNGIVRARSINGRTIAAAVKVSF